MNNRALYNQFHQQLALVPFLLVVTIGERLNRADVEKPHRIMRGRQFAPVTADAEWELSNLPTCCDYLYRYCIRVQQPGTKLELYLEEFRDSLAAMGITYSLRYIRQCFNQLVNAGLIKILKKWIGGVYQVIVRHAGMVENTTTDNGRAPQKPGSSDRKYAKTEPQSSMISFPITDIYTEEQQDAAANKKREEQETEKIVVKREELPPKIEREKKKPTLAQEVPSEGEASLNNDEPIYRDGAEPTELPQENPEKQQIVIALRDAGILNPELKALTLKYTLAEVIKAIDTLNQSRTRQKIENPGGWVSRCLRGEWWKRNQPTDSNNQINSGAIRSKAQTEEERKQALELERQEAEKRRRYPPELTSWYELATKAGIVDGVRLDYLPIQDGVVQVHLVMDSGWVLTPWTIAAAKHPRSPDDPLPLDAVEIADNYEPDQEIQRQIRESLGEIPGSEGGENLEDPPPE